MVIKSALLRARQMDAENLLPESRVRQLIDSLGIKFRERLRAPVEMLRLFLIQILHGNTAIGHRLRRIELLRSPSEAFLAAD